MGEKMSCDEMRGELEGRVAMYAVLSRLFREEVRDVPALFGYFSFPEDTESEKANTGAALMNGYLAQFCDGSETELAVDFAQLFVVHDQHDRNAAYPFESAFTSHLHVMMGDSRDDVLAIYRAHGFRKKPSCRLPEDHIALELEFEHMLACKALTAYREDDGDGFLEILSCQKAFLGAHLANWVPLLAQTMASRARTDFYQGLSRVTEGFVELDEAFLDGALQGER